jgi:hypothetical protein
MVTPDGHANAERGVNGCRTGSANYRVKEGKYMKQRKPRKRAPRDMVEKQKAALEKGGVENVAVSSGNVPNPHDG